MNNANNNAIQRKAESRESFTTYAAGVKEFRLFFIIFIRLHTCCACREDSRKEGRLSVLSWSKSEADILRTALNIYAHALKKKD